MFYRAFISKIDNLTNKIETNFLLPLETVTINIILNSPTKPLPECSNRVGFFMPITLVKVARVYVN